ncbi:MAG TPA: type II toxin-antitoxin system VapC family toxin [Iamia sp.]|nr:type II toxin-antitoxin system VapC family toxin [Iamia sp.]
MIVLDASVVVTALGSDGPDGDRTRARLRDEVLVAPHLVDIEVVSAWRRLVATGQLTDRRVDIAIADLATLGLRRIPHPPLLDRCWELRHDLTPYDATYVALAERLGSALLTFDARLAAAPGTRCEIEVL